MWSNKTKLKVLKPPSLQEWEGGLPMSKLGSSSLTPMPTHPGHQTETSVSWARANHHQPQRSRIVGGLNGKASRPKAFSRAPPLTPSLPSIRCRGLGESGRVTQRGQWLQGRCQPGQDPRDSASAARAPSSDSIRHPRGPGTSRMREGRLPSPAWAPRACRLHRRGSSDSQPWQAVGEAAAGRLGADKDASRAHLGERHVVGGTKAISCCE